MPDTLLLLLPELVAGQVTPVLTYDQSMALLDALSHISVVSKALATPPGSPANYALYAVPTGGTGAWSGHDGALAFYHDYLFGGWYFIPVRPGMVIFDQNTNEAYSWHPTGPGTGEWRTITYS